MKIYLAGSVPKGEAELKNFVDWRIKYQQTLKNIFDAEYVDPFNRILDESDYQAIVGNDCRHIKNCDLIIINAENQIGAGTAQEMIIAKYFTKPVISVIPKNSYHRRANLTIHNQLIADWIHPFIFTFSDFIIESIEGIVTLKDKVFSAKIKNINIIDEAVKYRDQIE
jgi:nucleoside 2-deoxyribosyltransferase